MVSSTAIPKTIAKTTDKPASKGMPKNPTFHLQISIGSTFGTKEIKNILISRKTKTIITPIIMSP